MNGTAPLAASHAHLCFLTAGSTGNGGCTSRWLDGPAGVRGIEVTTPGGKVPHSRTGGEVAKLLIPQRYRRCSKW